jgi:hypothetical protein
MSTLQIRKKSNFVWEHIDSVLGKYIVSNFFVSLDDNKFQVVEKGKTQRIKYDVANITIYDDTVGGMAEFFADITTLSIRLTELYYPAFDYANIPIFTGNAGITGSLKTQFTYLSGAQTFTLPSNSKVVVVTLNNAVIDEWEVTGNTLTITTALITNDEITVFGFISTSTTLSNYKELFTYSSGAQTFTIPANTYISLVTLNYGVISDYSVAGTTVTIGNSITLITNDEIVIYGITI